MLGEERAGLEDDAAPHWKVPNTHATDGVVQPTCDNPKTFALWGSRGEPLTLTIQRLP